MDSDGMVECWVCGVPGERDGAHDADDTEVICPNCAYQTTAGGVRNRE